MRRSRLRHTPAQLGSTFFSSRVTINQRELRPPQAMEPASPQIEQELPPAQRHIIKRPRLTKLLDEAEARIILLVAPAGYGKTTLAREWLRRRGRHALIYRVRDTIDPTVVAAGLAAAIAPIVPS